MFLFQPHDWCVVHPQLFCLLSGYFREQFTPGVQADAAEVLSFLLDNLGTGVGGTEVRVILSDAWVTSARQSSRERLKKL